MFSRGCELTFFSRQCTQSWRPAQNHQSSPPDCRSEICCQASNLGGLFSNCVSMTLHRGAASWRSELQVRWEFYDVWNKVEWSINWIQSKTRGLELFRNDQSNQNQVIENLVNQKWSKPGHRNRPRSMYTYFWSSIMDLFLQSSRRT